MVQLTDTSQKRRFAVPCWNQVGTKLREDPSKVFLVSPCYAQVPWALLAPGSRHFSRLSQWGLQHPQWQRSPPGGEEHADAETRSVLPSSAQGFGSSLPRGHEDEASGMHRWKSCFCLRNRDIRSCVDETRSGATPRTSLRLRKDNLCDPVEARNRLAARRDQSALTYETLVQAGHRRRRPSSSSSLGIPC